MKLPELRAAVVELRDEAVALSELDDITPEQDARLDAVVTEIEAREAEIAKLEARQAVIERAAKAPKDDETTRGFSVPNVSRKSDPYDLNAPLPVTAGEARGRAFEAIERTAELADEHKEAATRLIQRAERPDGRVSRHIVATGSPENGSASAKHRV